MLVDALSVALARRAWAKAMRELREQADFERRLAAWFDQVDAALAKVAH